MTEPDKSKEKASFAKENDGVQEVGEEIKG
jgi:hypothetical protein